LRGTEPGAFFATARALYPNEAPFCSLTRALPIRKLKLTGNARESMAAANSQPFWLAAKSCGLIVVVWFGNRLMIVSVISVESARPVKKTRTRALCVGCVLVMTICESP